MSGLDLFTFIESRLPGKLNKPMHDKERAEFWSNVVILITKEMNGRNKELEAKLAEAAKPCEWTEDEDEGIWTATCGLVDCCFNEGGPIENKVHHCVGCGHPVVVKGQEARKKGAQHVE